MAYCESVANMKLIVGVIVILVGVALENVTGGIISFKQLSTIYRYHIECQARTEVSDGVAYGVIAGRFPNDPKLANHLLCLHQKLGFQDEDGNLQQKAILDAMRSAVPPKSNAQQMLENCAVKKISPSKTATDLGRCLYKMVTGQKWLK